MQRATSLRYQRHLASLEDVLPAHVLELIRMPGVHNAEFVEARWSEDRRDLHIVLRGGWDIEFSLTLTYRDAVVSPIEEWAIARIVRSGTEDVDTSVLYKEFDWTCDGLLENRVLVHTGHWFTIRCSDLCWTKVDLPETRRFPLPERDDRFPGGPPTPYPITRGALDPYRSRLDWRLPTVRDRFHPEPSRHRDRQYIDWRLRDLRKRLSDEQAIYNAGG